MKRASKKVAKPKPTHTVKFFRVAIRPTEWYWRATAANGNIIADGGEGYARRVDCVRALRNFLDAAKAGTVEVKA